MDSVIQETGRQQRSSSEIHNWLSQQREADQAMMDARMNPKTASQRVLWINNRNMMIAKAGGYPVDLYHPNLESRQALKEEEESALAAMGYTRKWINKEYPKPLFRRNMAKQYEPKFDPATGIQLSAAFVEERVVRKPEDEAVLRRMKGGVGLSDWFDKITDLPEIEDGPSEDPSVTIARLQGQIDGLESSKGKRS